MKEQTNIENLIDKNPPEKLSRKYRFLIFLILFILSSLMNNSRQNNLLNNETYILSNIIYIIISLIENRKKVTFIIFLIIGILYIIFSLSQNNVTIMGILFIISGLKHYKDIFIPIWIDQFGIKQYKTLLMYIYLNNIFESVILKLIRLIIDPNKWFINGVIFGVLIIILDCLLLYFPQNYFSLSNNFVGYDNERNKELINTENIDDKMEQASLFEKQADYNDGSMIEFIKTIIGNKVYIFSSLTLFFYVFVFQILNSKISISNTADFLGLIIGGICLLCIGGYENKKSSIFLGVSSIISYLGSLMIAFSSESIFFIGIFLFIFFSVPILLLIKCFIISSLPNKYKGSGFALSSLLENISILVEPQFNKFLKEKLGKDKKTLCWKIHINIYILELIFCLLLIYYKHKNNKKEEEVKQDNGKELENIENK